MEGRQTQGVRSVETTDESATGSVFLFSRERHPCLRGRDVRFLEQLPKQLRAGGGLRNAATWNVRTGGASARFDHLYSPAELGEWVEPLRELSSGAEQAYVFFNNNNQTNGVAQAPAGALLLRRLLDEENVPAA